MRARCCRCVSSPRYVFFMLFFELYWYFYTAFYLLQQQWQHWDLGDKGRGLRMVSSPRYVFFIYFFDYSNFLFYFTSATTVVVMGSGGWGQGLKTHLNPQVCVFFNYTNIFTVYSTYYCCSGGNDWDLGNEALGMNIYVYKYIFTNYIVVIYGIYRSYSVSENPPLRVWVWRIWVPIQPQIQNGQSLSVPMIPVSVNPPGIPYPCQTLLMMALLIFNKLKYY